MNLREYQVIDGMNIATTKYGRFVLGEGRRFQATAAQVAEVMCNDDRYGPEYDWATGANVGAILRNLARGYPERREPLVERVGTKKWRLTKAGVGVLSA